jgi:sirohydrochlorin ferrochelatase
VTDFELDSRVAIADVSSVPPVSASPKADASAARAQHIVKLMSDNLLKDFAKAGYTTKLLHPSDARPDDGFLITGVFAQVGEDNRLRVAGIGSGQGAGTLQLYVAARDLAHFTPPIYTVDPADTSGAKPGAVIEINPNADAVRYSIEADITDKDIKQSAQRISADLVKRINAAVKSEGDPLNRYAKP